MIQKPFNRALYLHPTTEAGVEHNVAKNGQPIATVKAGLKPQLKMQVD